jgi:UDPglucose 6-dehydrogenase
MKSTVPVGTCKKVFAQLDRSDVSYVACPEFLREGSSINDFFNADRVIIGTESDSAFAVMNEILSPTTSRIFRTDPISAEMIKYVSNSFLAVKLSFVNSIAGLSGRLGANPEAVLTGAGMDPRIGSQFLMPGPGWGGSCFPKDTAALLHTAREIGDELKIVKSAIEANSDHILRIARKIHELSVVRGSSCSVAVLGLTFKAGTDDLRESPSIRVCKHLLDHGVEVRAYDPMVSSDRSALLPRGLERYDDIFGAVSGTSLIAVLTEWPEFIGIDPEALRIHMSNHTIFDSRNIMNAARWRQAGFEYIGLSQLTQT